MSPIGDNFRFDTNWCQNRAGAPSGRRQNARLKFLRKHRGGNTSRRPKDGPKKERKFLSRIPLQKTGSGAALFSREFRPNPREILESVSGVSGVSGGGSSAYPLSPIWRHSGPENSNQYLLPARRTAQCRLETPAEIRVVTGSRGPKKAHQKGREFLPKIPGRSGVSGVSGVNPNNLLWFKKTWLALVLP